MNTIRIKFLFLSLFICTVPMQQYVCASPSFLKSISASYDALTDRVQFLAQYKQAVLTASALLTYMYAMRLIKEYSAYLVETDREFLEAVQREYQYKIHHPREGHSDSWTGHVAKAKCQYYFCKGMPVLLRKYTQALSDVENNRANDLFILKEEIRRTINSYRNNGFLWSLLIGSYVSPHSIETPFSQPVHG